MVSAVSFVGKGALDRAAGELLGCFKHHCERVPVIGISRQCGGVKDELAAGRLAVGADDRSLYPELVGRARLALADALDLGSVEGIELPAALALTLRANLVGA